MQIINWNVNGLRAIMKKNLPDYVRETKADIFCFQEIKISDSALEKEGANLFFPDYVNLWHPAKRPGYSGTGMLIKENLSWEKMPSLSWDEEGRILAIDLKNFYLVNVYFPNANNELSRLNFKMNFNNKLYEYLKKLDQKKPLVITGDFNVAHKEIDLARPRENIDSPGFTPTERASMDKFIALGMVDVFRYFYPKKIQYTWWSFRAGARARNVGWRIDYFCCSQRFLKNVKKISLENHILGSDHCPVVLEF